MVQYSKILLTLYESSPLTYFNLSKEMGRAFLSLFKRGIEVMRLFPNYDLIATTPTRCGGQGERI